MATAWIMVRLSRGTHARLQRVRESLRVAADQGKIALDLDPRDRVSLDQVIDILIDFREAHAERRRRAGRRRRSSQAQLDQVEPSADQKY